MVFLAVDMKGVLCARAAVPVPAPDDLEDTERMEDLEDTARKEDTQC